jgi:hypothetical protein
MSLTIATMQEEWRNYRDAVYPKGIDGVQNRETHQAFFAGAFSAITAMNKLSELPEDQAMAALAKLQREVIEICEARMNTLKARN